MNVRHFGTIAFVAAVFLACSDDPANEASPGAGTDAGSGADGANGADAAKEPDAPDDGGSSPDGSSSSDGGQDASVCLSDAGGAGGGPDDQPFSCTPNLAVQGDHPTYVLGGARPAWQGGVVQPGLYRATKVTNMYVEDTPGDCNGKTPPTPTTYAVEMELRPTHYLMRSAGITIAGSWWSCDNKFTANVDCPGVGKARGYGYTAVGTTFVRDGGSANYVDGGCRYSLVYEFVKQ